eukprot:11010492-Ditylum_brightwellii.AAC.1
METLQVALGESASDVVDADQDMVEDEIEGEEREEMDFGEGESVKNRRSDVFVNMKDVDVGQRFWKKITPSLDKKSMQQRGDLALQYMTKLCGYNGTEDIKRMQRCLSLFAYFRRRCMSI